jgi:hypothetical protein
VDKSSQYSHLIPCRDTDSDQTLVAHMRREVFRHHLLLEVFISDRDIKFIADYWHAMFQSSNTICASTRAHPQTDGQTERVKRTIGHLLRAYTDHHLHDWIRHIDLTEVAYNTTYISTRHTDLTMGSTQWFLIPPPLRSSHLCSPPEVGVVNRNVLLFVTIAL